ncbi:MAG: SUMF1/EgtB/PvdO family nonheme iron enzyme [Saprospiraceae bacterium]|nr:SUMF1/EgtB/PvdO family nonheme iron enzyme [Saprospiraceae bacterium]
MCAKTTDIQVFIAYSQKDNVFLDGLRTHIKPLERTRNLQVWFDGEIRPGEPWDEVIKSRLEKADIVLALISPNSLASDYFYEKEMKDALERHHEGKTRVVPILLLPCLWKETPMADLQGLPNGMKPVGNWRTLDDGWHNVMLGLLDILNEISNRPESASTDGNASPYRSQKATSESEAWEFVIDAPSRSTYEQFLEIFPNGTYASQARLALDSFVADDIAWKFAQNNGSDQAIQKYLKKYPKGLHANEARQIIDPFHDLMVLVKGGVFEMGDVFNDGFKMESPVHKVSLEDFWICKYPVTQGLWKSVMGRDNNPSEFGGGEDKPVENVSWMQVNEFISALNKKSGNSYRLPTEAEWEYAARERGLKRRFGNGKDLANPEEINFCGLKSHKHSYSVLGIFREKTTPVNMFRPNALGLFDMSGNVWEWCSDWYSEDYYKELAKNEITQNPQGPETGSGKVIRGGSWHVNAAGCRTMFRDASTPDDRGADMGFRLALSNF